jgi:hypothetical protein
MTKLIYKVVSACGALGYVYPKESIKKALKGGVDVIISEAESMEAGSYHRRGQKLFLRLPVMLSLVVPGCLAQDISPPPLITIVSPTFNQVLPLGTVTARSHEVGHHCW